MNQYIWITITIHVDLANLELLGFPACSHWSFSRQSKTASFALQPVSWAPICPKPLQPLGEYLSHWSSSNVLTALAAVGFPRFPAWQQSQCRLPSVPARLWDLWVSRMQISSVDDCLVLGSPPFITFLKASMAASRAAWFMCSSLLRNVLTRPTWSGATTEFHYHLSLPDSEVQRDQHAARTSHSVSAGHTQPVGPVKDMSKPLLRCIIHHVVKIICNPSGRVATADWATHQCRNCIQLRQRPSHHKKNKKDRESTPHRSQSQSSAHFISSFSIRVHMASLKSPPHSPGSSPGEFTSGSELHKAQFGGHVQHKRGWTSSTS